MEFKRDALLLRSVDYGENDKIVTLLTADGKLSAGLKGVRKAGAKLKFAAQPFCFAEYVFVQKGERNTVLSASLHDGFFSLWENLRAFYAAAVVAEACEKTAYEDMPSGELLIAAVTALKGLCEGNCEEVLTRFLLDCLKISGYAVRADVCPSCGKRPEGAIYFDMTSGAFHCADCGVGVRASETTYRAVRAVYGEEEGAEQEGFVRALRLLSAYFTYCTDEKLNSIGEFMKIS